MTDALTPSASAAPGAREATDDLAAPQVGLVIIGRNEGERLARCLASVRRIPNRVYVDSGSTDGSVRRAFQEGASVVELPVPPHFTAARARNAGLAQLLSAQPDLEFAQMVDGDCEVREGWMDAALAALRADPGLALVFGRRRERFPERSVYNALCDDEWNVPVGEAPACGGDVLCRISALRQAGFYNPAMIAGEEPDLCMRLIKLGWRLRRIDAEMTLHDASIEHFSQWWSRARRAGHAFGELAFLHPEVRNPNWLKSAISILVWGAIMPLVLLGAILLSVGIDPWWWTGTAALVLFWTLRVIQLGRRQRQRGLRPWVARASGLLLMIGKVPQFLGLFGYHRNRLMGHRSRIIEYKASANP